MIRSAGLALRVGPICNECVGEFHLRGASASDLPQVESLMESCVSGRLTLARKWLYRLFSRRFVVLVEDAHGGGVVAADIYRLRHCTGLGWVLHEELIVVHPEWRKRGLSTMVRNHALNYFREWPVPFITSIIYSNNSASLRGALSAGWKIHSTELAPNKKAADRKKHLLVHSNKTFGKN